MCPGDLQLEIREATEADWLDLKLTRLASLKDAPRAFGLSYRDAAAYSDAQWRARAAGRTLPRYFLARQGPAPVGMSGCVVVANQMCLIATWVTPQHRQCGIGRQLVLAVMDHARQQGHHTMQLMVAPDNQAACALYLSLGFGHAQHTEKLDSHPDVIVRQMVADLRPAPGIETR